VFIAAVLLSNVISLAVGQAKDPGPRAGAAGAGSYFSTLNANEQQTFLQALARFQEVDSVSGTIEAGSGLGLTFNGNSCAMCHAQPAIGGSSPGQNSPQNPVPNPQVALAKLDGATNTVPSFITASGPVREARFVATDPTNVYSSLDGGVHALYTIKGRSDASGCNLAQPNFTSQLSYGNVIFRIPTPVFGLGLVENTPDATLQTNLNSTSSARYNLGIGGSFNTSGNDGTITRFGWKAQNKSLLIFASEAYNVEQGVTNEGFPNERNTTAGCVFNATPENSSNILNGNTGTSNFGTTVGTLAEMSSDVVNFALFMRLSAPPIPATPNSSITNGQAFIQPDRLQPLPFAHAYNRSVETHRDVECDVSSVLGFRAASHGRWVGRWHYARRRWGGPVPHGSVVGTGPETVLLARWAHNRPGVGNSVPLFCDQLLLHAGFDGAVVLCADHEQRVRT
jgi:hypothetical protein